jgi:glycerol-3-phosphate dehydrogenase (NAD(P)+)
MRIAVLGAGSWGTTLADLLAKKGQDVLLWAYEADVVEAINRSHLNPVFLPDSPLAPSLRAVGDAAVAVKDAELILSVAPSHALRSVLRLVRDTVPMGAIIASATKGLETDTLALMSDVIAAELPQARLAVLSGPSFAREVYEGRPTAVVASSVDPVVAEVVQEAFATPRFRVYTNSDVVGVELGGALKNVIAIATGVLDGLGLGNNARAALLTRGLAEITRLGVAHGADPLTFAGLAGMGDLVLTATGDLSRNRQLGMALAKGETYEAYRARHRTVAEGANAAMAATALGQQLGVELPISAEVAAVLFEGRAPAEAIRNLMERTLKAEQWR